MSDRKTELDALIAAQERDAAWGHRAELRGPSLDFTFEDGGTFGEVVGYRTPTGDGAIRRIPRPQKWTRRAIVKAIRAWVTEHGELPMHNDWNRPNGRGIPSAASVTRAFGSWNAGIAAAGFEPRGVGHCRRNPVPEGKVRQRIRPQKRTARLTSADLAAAYVLYDRQGLSLPELAALIWERYGYPSANACRDALWKGFHAEGFRLRTKSEARMRLPAERRRAISAKMLAARWTPLTDAQCADIRRRRGASRQADLAAEYGVSQSTISRIQRGVS